MPKISDAPDNTIHISIPAVSIPAVSVPAVSAPSHSASITPVSKGKRAVSVKGKYSIVSSSIPIFNTYLISKLEASSVSAAAAAPSASASASHVHHKASVKAVLRARGMRGAGFRAAQHKSEPAEWESASYSASASAAYPVS